MYYPEFIKQGDTIGVTATSAGNNDELHIRKLESAINQFKKMGYLIKETSNVRTDYYGRSSTKEIRAKEFMELIEDKNVNAILTARGGEYLLEILPFINFEKIRQNPKWVQGYSDTTGIAFCITTICDIATIYFENFTSFGMEPWHKSLNDSIKILEGKDIELNSFDKFERERREEVTGLEPYLLTDNIQWKNARGEDEIKITGRLIGGCLDILVSLVGTKFDMVKYFCEKYKEDGIIWFLDNCELSSEEVLRGLWQLREAGWFKNTKGFIFGRTMTRSSNTGVTFEEAIMQTIGELNVPIIFDADIGHVPPQMPLINGSIAHINCSNGCGRIMFEKK